MEPQSASAISLRALAAAALTMAASCALADIKPLHKGKRLALVLSGGGALGFAHLGALEWLEQHHIPTDYIVGTSAGAVFGGWYSTGGVLFPQDQNTWPQSRIRPENGLHLLGLLKNLEAIDWDEVATGIAPFESLSMRRKAEDRDYPATIQLEMIPGLVPEKTRGILPRPTLGLLFDGLTSQFSVESLHSSDGYGYDNLPIPFRANTARFIGTLDTSDRRAYRKFLITDSYVDLQDPKNPNPPDRVWLGQAIRASSAYPELFTPVRLKTGILADGGFLDNLDALEPTQQPTWRGGFDDILALDLLPNPQSSAHAGVRRLSSGVHLAVVPLSSRKYGPLDYRSWRAIAWEGYQTMQRIYDDPESSLHEELDTLALDKPEWDAYIIAKRKIAAQLVSPKVDLARLDPNAFTVTNSADLVNRQLATRSGSLLDPEFRATLEADFSRAIGAERLDSIGYYLSNAGQGSKVDLIVRPEPQSFGPPFQLRQAYGETSSHLPSALSFAERRIDPLGTRPIAEMVTDVSIGSENALRVELFSQPGGKPVFAAPSLFFQRPPPDLTHFITGQTDLSFERLGGQAVAGYVPDTFDEARIGFVAGNLYSGDYPRSQGQFQVMEASFERDTEDFSVAPTKGFRFSMEAQWHSEAPGSTEQFPEVKAESAYFKTVWRNGVVFSRASAGTSFGSTPPLPDKFSLGGFNSIGILRPGELAGDAFTYSSTGYRHRVASLPYLAGAIYAMAFFEVGGVTQTEGPSIHAEDLNLGILTDTKLGPFWIGASMEKGRYTSLQLVFGRS